MLIEQKAKGPIGVRGFSDRFNFFLDEAGYPRLNKGRLTAVAEDMGMSLSGARKWIIENTPPQTSKLIEICEKIALRRLNKKYNPKRIACWLEYGDDIVANPFTSGTSIATDHLIMGNIYVVVHEAAKGMGIDIYSIDYASMERLYRKIMDNVVDRKLLEPDLPLIKSLLVLAQKKML
ncbi:MAG: hypothetical protein KUG76_08265 [Gammaproteobacteria bacterium]|nr:hypothetical protein [Gammaproteobacteria bacterium]